MRGRMANTNTPSKLVPKTCKAAASADEIARKASRGEDISGYFTGKFNVARPVRRVNVDLIQGMLGEADERAARPMSAGKR
jgi:hypothetical protein